jgi:hypothetical protein
MKKLILALAVLGLILSAAPRAEAICIEIGGSQYCF